MERDPLARFIQDNRAAFDQQPPPLPVWNRVERELDGAVTQRQARTITLSWWRVAAAVVALVVVSGLAGRQIGQEAAQLQQLAVLNSIAPDFVEVQDYYEREIADRYAQLTNYQAKPDVQPNLQNLDAAMAELRAELLTAPADERPRLVRHLIESYRLKLDLLEHILSRLEAPPIPSSTTQKTNPNDKLGI